MEITRGDRSYTVAEGHDWFWKMFEDGTWEPSTFRIFDKFLDPERNYVDIGAWIGPTALYAAPRSKKVFAFEPDPVAFRSLVMNLALNRADNVVPYPVAVSNEWGGIPFGAKTGYGDSMSSQIWAKGDKEVPAVDFVDMLDGTDASFVKIDIEGGEKFLFKGSKEYLQEFKPTLHLSLHTPSFAGNVEAFAKPIIDELSVYPYFYDENFNPIELEVAFDEKAFNSIIATFTPIV